MAGTIRCRWGSLRGFLLLVLPLFGANFAATALAQTPQLTGLVAADAQVQEVASGFLFTEGPIADAEGNLYITARTTLFSLQMAVKGMY